MMSAVGAYLSSSVEADRILIVALLAISLYPKYPCLRHTVLCDEVPVVGLLDCWMLQHIYSAGKQAGGNHRFSVGRR